MKNTFSVELKYRVGDKAYLMKDNQLQEVSIEKINISITSEDKCDVTYSVNCTPMHADHLYKTPEEVLKVLKKNFNSRQEEARLKQIESEKAIQAAIEEASKSPFERWYNNLDKR